MKRIYQAGSVRSVLEQADTIVNVKDLQGDWQGVVVEMLDDDHMFEGTIIYFPGVRLNELKKEIGVIETGSRPKSTVEQMVERDNASTFGASPESIE